MSPIWLLALVACTPRDTGSPVKPGDSDTGVAPDSDSGDTDTGSADSDSGDTGDSRDSDTQQETDTDPGPVECDRTLGWKYVALGYFQTCGIHLDGCAECWGRGEEEGADDRDTGVYHWNGEDRPPAGDYVSISMIATPTVGRDTFNACGILSDGALVCWGSDLWGTNDTPGGTYAESITTSSYAAAIGTDNRVVTWGYAAMAPSGEYIDIAASYQIILLATDGSLVATYMDGDTEEVPPGTFIDVGAGDTYACALDLDGSVLCWDEFDPAHAKFYRMTQQAPDGAFEEVCVLGGSVGCVRDAAGLAQCWGGTSLYDAPADETFTQVECGFAHVCGVTTDNRIVCWGEDVYGETIPPT